MELRLVVVEEMAELLANDAWGLAVANVRVGVVSSMVAAAETLRTHDGYSLSLVAGTSRATNDPRGIAAMRNWTVVAVTKEILDWKMEERARYPFGNLSVKMVGVRWNSMTAAVAVNEDLEETAYVQVETAKEKYWSVVEMDAVYRNSIHQNPEKIANDPVAVVSKKSSVKNVGMNWKLTEAIQSEDSFPDSDRLRQEVENLS